MEPNITSWMMAITRDGEAVFEGSTTTREMVRSCEDLAAALTTSNTLPEMSVLLIGTSLVPDEEFTLQPEDEIEIAIKRIGRLTNSVRRV